MMRKGITKRRYKVRKDRRDYGLPVCRVLKKHHISQSQLYYQKHQIQMRVPRENSISNLEPYKEIIEAWVKDKLEKSNSKRIGVSKLHLHLQETQPDYTASENTLRKYVTKLKQILVSKRGAFLTLTHEPHECQADFGRFFYYDTNGIETEGQCVVLSFPNSSASYMQVLPGKSIEGMLTAMQNIFIRIGGVPKQIWLDNDTCYVHCKVIDKKKVRVINPLFQSFIEHYGFAPVFLSAYAANEKGSVENALGFLRRNILVPLPTIADFDAYNKELLNKSEACADRKHNRKPNKVCELFEQDKQSFLPLPSAHFSCASHVRHYCDKFGCVKVGNTKIYFVDTIYAKSNVYVTLDYRHCTITAEDGTVLYNDMRLYRDQLHEPVDWETILPRLAKHPSPSLMNFVRVFPISIRKFMATSYPKDLSDFMKNVVMVYKLVGIEKALDIASTCIKQQRLSKADFLASAKQSVI